VHIISTDVSSLETYDKSNGNFVFESEPHARTAGDEAREDWIVRY
jgi:hypothetical protein